MLRFLADQNFNERLLKALVAREPSIDVVLAREAELEEFDDPSMLQWASEHQRAILTHDVRTMAGFASARLRAGLPMAGVVEIDLKHNSSMLIQDLLIIYACEESLEGQVLYILFAENISPTKTTAPASPPAARRGFRQLV